jgi:hypothetical protein
MDKRLCTFLTESTFMDNGLIMNRMGSMFLGPEIQSWPGSSEMVKLWEKSLSSFKDTTSLPFFSQENKKISLMYFNVASS